MKQLTAKKALEYVLRIEALTEQIEDVYAEVRSYDGENNDSVIRDAVEARAEMRARSEDAAALIGSFDWDEDGNFLLPNAEPAWPEIAAKLRESAGRDRKLLAMVDQIDKLHRLAIASGITPISKAELDAEIARVEAA
jgi:hypothetical protein